MRTRENKNNKQASKLVTESNRKKMPEANKKQMIGEANKRQVSVVLHKPACVCSCFLLFTSNQRRLPSVNNILLKYLTLVAIWSGWV
jgi:hypothetical protein